jgi:uncharacterized membrane protein
VVDQPPEGPRLPDTDRTEAFSDAVLAIAMTLLVFDLKTPHAGPGHLLDGLGRQWPAYVAYLASFLYLAVIWANHHSLFTRIRYVDRGLKWANVGMLLTSATLPFPTAVLSAALQAPDLPDRRAAIGLYAGVAAALCLSWVVAWAYLRRHPNLLEEHVEPEFFKEEQLRGLVGAALYVIGGVLGCLIEPLIALGTFTLLPPFYAVTSEGLRHSRLPYLRRVLPGKA